YEYQIFTANGVFDNLQSEVFNVPIEKWVYDYVDFMVDPQSSIGEVIEKINTIYQGKQSYFDRKAYGEISSFDLRLAGAVSPNTLPEIDVISLVKVSLIVIIMTIVIYAIIESFFLTRRKKENDILKRYQYNVIIVTCVKNFIFLLMIGLIFVIFGRYICEAINSIVNVIFRSYNTKNTIVILDYMSLTASLGICFT
ncbi:ABC transporter ATP-binding protein, partial [Coprobacillus cateniformis]|nr:ABC transporter ATP-binding protein [Coprobacillus cateniformis]